MKTIKVEVKADLLERLSKVRKPLLAIAELIWNAVDADATEVDVAFVANLINGLESIVVRDNGTGMRPEEAEAVFTALGGSWKRKASRSRTKHRLLHGRAGKGRLRAFSLGATVSWDTCYVSDKSRFRYSVIGNLVDLGTFTITDQVPANGFRGTEVRIEQPTSEFPSLRGERARLELTQQFAPYLAQYPDVRVKYDGAWLRPDELKVREQSFELPPTPLANGTSATATLKIVEWNTEVDRALFLCDASGFALSREPVDVYAPGFSFTAYVSSQWVRELHDSQVLELDELRPEEVQLLLTESRKRIRQYFRGRQAESAADLVADWKKENSYPFSGEPASDLERAKREVFDIVAVSVSSHLPDLATQDPKSRQFSFRLLRQALEESPAAVKKILTEVIEMPKAQKEDLASLLDQISFNAIISASKLVTARLDFLRALELLVFDPETKKVLLERKELHKILEHYTWLFGEQFTLSASDKSLNEVLDRHLALLGRPKASAQHVAREGGRRGIVDLMLSRRIPHNQDEREHLVIELKRPTQKVTLKVLSQIKSYAFAVANDERFRDTETRWIFWVVSNEMDDEARRDARQRLRPAGLVHDDEELRIEVWAKTWSQLLEECRARLKFFREALDYDATDDSALALLRAAHGKYLPQNISEVAP